MSLVLHPQKSFTVVRQITNHLDTDTNYVRAVIRNAYTDAIIDTLDLTDKGGQRFSKNWQVPADPSGEGFYLSIVTSVYTDSGYTTKNANYGDEESTYLVENKVNNTRGGGSGVDARTIRRIIQEELAAEDKAEPVDIPEPVKMPEMPPMRWDEVLSAIDGLKTALKPEKPEKVDFKPLYEALQTILSAVHDKEVTPVTDLSPVLAKLEDKNETDDITKAEIITLLDGLGEGITKELSSNFSKLLRDTTFQLAPTTATMEPPKEKQIEPVPFDLSKISS